MPNTTNYSFPTPADTDLVKNGADAIRDLGDAVDTAMNTALGTKKAGMVLLNTTSFSGVASQSFNNVFSATYTNYVVHFNITASANDVLRLRLRNGGTDRTGATDYLQMTSGIDTSGNAQNIVNSGGTTFWNVGKSYTAITTGLFTVYEPFAAGFTNMTGEMVGINSPNTALTNYRVAGNYQQSQSNDGFTLLPASGTISGSVSVFGVNK